MAAVFVAAARHPENMTQVWDGATKAEQRDLIRGILDAVICDADGGRLTALRPKPAFVPLLWKVGGLREQDRVFGIPV
jgi:hypothetical protein